MRRPGRISAQLIQRADSQKDHQYRKHGHRPAAGAFFTSARNEGQCEEQPNPDHRHRENQNRFQVVGQQSEQCIQPEKEEIRLRYRIDLRGIGDAVRAFGSEIQGAAQNAEHHNTAEDQVFADRLREERYTLLLHQVFVFLFISRFDHGLAWHRVFVDTFSKHQPQVKADERDYRAGNYKDVQREKARQGLAGYDRAGQHKMDKVRPDNRNTSHHRRADTQSPVSILIEAQDLSCEGHAQSAKEQHDPGDPGHLARIFEGSEQKYLRYVQDHNTDQEIRAPVVHRAQEPTKLLVIVQVFETGVSLARRGDVNECEARAGDDLQDETEQRATAEDIKPALCIFRHMVPGG